MRIQIKRIIAILLVVCFLMSVAAVSASAQIDTYKKFRITSVNSNKVLDVADATTEAGANICQEEWRNTDFQKWKIISLDGVDTGYYRIDNVKSGMCLDIYGASKKAGTKLIQYTWHNADNQKFKLIPLSGDVYKIECKHSKMVLDVNEESILNDAQIIQWTWHNGLNQQWFITAV